MKFFIQIFVIVFFLNTLWFLCPTQQYARNLSGLHVTGNKIVNDQAQQVILRGVNRSGTEYNCIKGDGIFDGHSDLASIQAMKDWGINEVNIPINEDCWLGINGVKPDLGGTNYQKNIINYSKILEDNGIYPVISLFWTANGMQRATGIATMPDADHAGDLWKSVATTFKADNAVIFRLAEEPHPEGNSDNTAAWQCWKNGDSSCNEGFNVVGFQTLLNTVRSTGAVNIVQIPGLKYANSMTQFLKYKPLDSTGNSMAVVDVYPDQNPCGNINCYNKYYAPIIDKMPFMAGEFGESVNGNACSVEKSNELLDWLDQHNSGYSAWTWNTWGTDCGDLSLITSYYGTPHSPNGSNYKSHLLEVLSKPIQPQISPALIISITPTVSVNTFASNMQKINDLILAFLKSFLHNW